MVLKADSNSRAGRSKDFFKGCWSELKKVHWPTKKEVIRYTGVVIVTCLIAALFLYIFDKGFDIGISWLVS